MSTKRSKKATTNANTQASGKSTKGGESQAEPKGKAPPCASPHPQGPERSRRRQIGATFVAPADLIAEMKAKGLWTSLNGETPGAKVYAAMIRETTAEGGGSRFTKVDRGMVAV